MENVTYLFILRYIASLEAVFVHTKHRLILCFVIAFPAPGVVLAQNSGTLFVLSLWVTGNVPRYPHSFHPLVDIPQIYPCWVTFTKGCTIFQLSTYESHLCHSISNRHTWMVTRSCRDTWQDAAH